MNAQIKFLPLLLAFAFLISCKTSQPEHSSMPQAGMFKVAILYPNGENKTFDMDYYEKKTHADGSWIFGQKFKIL